MLREMSLFFTWWEGARPFPSLGMKRCLGTSFGCKLEASDGHHGALRQLEGACVSRFVGGCRTAACVLQHGSFGPGNQGRSVGRRRSSLPKDWGDSVTQHPNGQWARPRAGAHAGAFADMRREFACWWSRGRRPRRGLPCSRSSSAQNS